MSNKMTVIGMTGGSGSGKGYVGEIFASYGVPSIDTDAVAHDLYRVGEPCLTEIIANFGNGVKNDDGSLNRRALGDLVFADREKLETLNRITHRYIKEKTLSWLADRQKSGTEFAIVDAPVLFESGFDSLCDVTLAVVADRQTRIDRILRRDGIDRDRAEARIANQQTEAYYRSRCDFVIENPHGTDPTQQVLAVLEVLRSRKNDSN